MPGTTVRNFVLTRFATSTISFMAVRTSSRAEGSRPAKFTLDQIPRKAEITPSSIPSRSMAAAMRFCSSTGRAFMPLSSQAVNPWSAANFN